MTAAQRRILDKFAKGGLPLNRAIAAALKALDEAEDRDTSPRVAQPARVELMPLFGDRD
jgi:hypothetical protein